MTFPRMTARFLGRQAGGLLVCSAGLAWSQVAVAPPHDTAESPARRPRVLLVKPVVLCEDDGTRPARAALPKKHVDRMHAPGGVEVLYLDPVEWKFGRGKRGETGLAALARQGREQGFIHADPRVVTLLFVSAIEGKGMPLGRALPGGNACVVCLAPGGGTPGQASPGLLVAQALGDCLQSRPADADPGANGGAGDLSGGGSRAEPPAAGEPRTNRLGAALPSPPVVERVTCHTQGESARLLTDESWEPYLSGATDEVLRFAFGLRGDAGVPREAAARARFARDGHESMALAFTPGEEASLRKSVARINHLTGRDWPLVSRLPWHFIKTKREFCGGHPHTRGLAIVLPAGSLARVTEDEDFALFLLVHEKFHVVQRLVPRRFEDLFRTYGYLPVRLAGGEAARANLVQNPDALYHEWAVRAGSELVMVATDYRTMADGMLDMQPVARRLAAMAGGCFRLGEVLEGDPLLDGWREGFPVKQGFDDPRELSAFTSSMLLRREYLGGKPADLGPAQEAVYQETRRVFREILRITGE